jgi:hypothetical protein
LAPVLLAPWNEKSRGVFEVGEYVAGICMRYERAVPSLCVKLTDTLFPPAVWPGRDRDLPHPEDDIVVGVAEVLDVSFLELVVKVVELVGNVVELLEAVEDAKPALSSLAPQTPLFACAAWMVLFM